MPKIGRDPKNTPVAGSRSGGMRGYGISLMSRTVPTRYMRRSFASQHGEVVVTKAADPEKVAAYRASQVRGRS